MSKIILALYILTTTSALVIVKLGTTNGLPVSYADSKLHFNINPHIIIGTILFGLSFVTYIYLISRYDLGYIIPLAAGFVYIIMFLASYFIFDEVFTVTKIIGIGLIVLGITLLNVK